jgi:Na+-transporting NADH:ubiquinone oxidoreductase subunit A
MRKISKGLDLPLTGAPEQSISSEFSSQCVAVLGRDFHGLKPTMEVAVGDRVRKGQVVLTDKKNPGIQYTAPAGGEVVEINRGAKRAFLSLVIRVDDDDAVSFGSHPAEAIGELSRDVVQTQLIESGEWTAFKTRPFSKVPAKGSVPNSIFVTATDSRPHAPDPNLIISEETGAFNAGVAAISRLTDGAVFVCMNEHGMFDAEIASARVERFAGKHPAGLAGTHIHTLDPVSVQKTVWQINYQDVIAIGHLFLTGELYTTRIISLAGPSVLTPTLVKVRRGADLSALTDGRLKDGQHRVISGSVLDGFTAADAERYLGRFHTQVAVLEEGTQREFLQFVMPGTDKYSLTGLFASWILGKKSFDLTTSTGGSDRSIIPLGTFERLTPLDILPTQLLRALVVDDVEASIELGCLELDEDDVALYTCACPGKYEYGPILRTMLEKIEVEG